MIEQSDLPALRKWLKSMLLTEQVTIVFTKSDGSPRVLKCTLDPAVLPEQQSALTETKRHENQDVLAVWDVEAGGWRSFRLASIKEIRFSLGEGGESV